ncbi:MAG TPA: PRC-barrel domain-containing protein [Methanoregulaceae archaeon]|mgnify:CR=1 FL=1|jgi:sporulation protein YlmC with PRC-barrel domain|nr:PRC-barrel domain-containing protein [Methanoregulaceae archaeon]MDD5049460.1 PRC-barrel domain-containing protein [Methanoregulaceae archaeon]MDD5685984.1 PRC-barrel domain-containing protein [Methanoregulaceae archaeon]HOP66756.1 PRC-barrel domain-containing protein [Methanoregulaceae archaeon]HPJ73394.1 PRC-barrel domain-containing protein [Methanoregulaceae archaeon]
MIAMRTQITELFGLSVYTEKSLLVGEVEDVLIDIEGRKMESLVVGKLNQELVDIKNYKGLKIPFRIIRSIGDIVLIRHLPGAFKTGNFDDV